MPLPAQVPVVSHRLTVRPIVEGDLPDLLPINGDPEVTRFLPYPTWQSLDDGQAWLQRMRALAEGGTGRQFVLVLNATSRIVGTLLLFRFEESSARAELGYVLGRRHWGLGLMREAITAFCTYAFSHLALRRLEAEVNPSNAASARLLLDVGFTLEGTLRKRWVARDGAYDTNFFGLLAEEWPRP
jgi:RimJ/RimL family protein N-acetyltransferase